MTRATVAMADADLFINYGRPMASRRISRLISRKIVNSVFELIFSATSILFSIFIECNKNQQGFSKFVAETDGKPDTKTSRAVTFENKHKS